MSWAEGTPLPTKRRASRGECPRCRGALAQRIVGALDVDQCGACAGLFLDAVVVAQLLFSGGADALEALRDFGEPASVRRTPVAWCPVCGDPMGRRPVVAGALARLAVCRSHGLWLDRGDLTAVIGALSTRPIGRVADLERAAFADLATQRRFASILAHARALAARSTARTGSLGVLADLFG